MLHTQPCCSFSPWVLAPPPRGSGKRSLSPFSGQESSFFQLCFPCLHSAQALAHRASTATHMPTILALLIGPGNHRFMLPFVMYVLGISSESGIGIHG